MRAGAPKVSEHDSYFLAPEAQLDLLEIWNHIADDSFDAADRVILKLHGEFARLALSPGIGHHRFDLAAAEYRFWVVSPYVIAYLWETEPLEYWRRRPWRPSVIEILRRKN